MRRIVNILAKMVSAIVLALIFLPLLVALLFEIPAVQNFVAREATEIISRKLGTPMLATMTPLPANMRRAAAKGFINATDCADYLTKKGMPFRDAYKCTGTMVAACIREGKTLEELTLDEFKQYSDLFEDDVYTAIDLTTCCEGRTSYGGPTKASVMKQIADVKGKLA